MPISRQARMMRTAISPRLAIRILFTDTLLYCVLRRGTGSVRLQPRQRSSMERRSRGGRTPMVGRLLVRVREAEERRFAPRASEKLEAGGQRAPGGAHRHGDRGKAGARREQLVVVAARRVEIADETRRVAPRRVDERVELRVVHQCVDRGAELLAKQLAPLAARALAQIGRA